VDRPEGQSYDDTTRGLKSTGPRRITWRSVLIMIHATLLKHVSVHPTPYTWPPFISLLLPFG